MPAPKIQTKRIPLVAARNLRADQAAEAAIDLSFRNVMLFPHYPPNSKEPQRLYLQRRPGLVSETPNITSNHGVNLAIVAGSSYVADTDGAVYKDTTYVGTADNSADCVWISHGYADASLTVMPIFTMRTGGVGYIYIFNTGATLGTTTFTGNLSIGSETITNVSGTNWQTNVRVGALLSGTGIPSGTRVKAIDTGASTITMGTDSDTVVTATATNTGVTVTYDHLLKIMDSTIQGQNVLNAIYMDGYIFALTTTGRIYQCEYNDPQTWKDSAFIPAIRKPGQHAGILNVNGKIAVIKAQSIEFFENVGNPQGSVLKRIDKFINVGGGPTTGGTSNCGIGIAQYENYVAMLTNSYGVRLWNADTNEIEEITDAFMERELNSLKWFLVSANNLEIKMFAWRGRTFVFVFNDSTASGNDWALLYDVENKFWSQISFEGITQKMWIPCADQSDAHVYWISYTGASPSQAIYSWDDKETTIAWGDQTSSAINSVIVTGRMDFGTRKYKRINRVSLIGDAESGTNAFTLTWSDDDYGTYSNSRTLDLTTGDATTTELGALRRPSFKLVNNAAAAPFRLEGLEIEYEELAR